MRHAAILSQMNIYTSLCKFECELEALITKCIILGDHDPSLGIMPKYLGGCQSW